MTASNGREPERRTRELHALTEVAKMLTSPHGLPEVLRAALDKLAEVFEPAELGAMVDSLYIRPTKVWARIA